MRIIGIDFGDARTGFASSDASGILSTAQGIVKVSGFDDAVKKSADKVKELGGEFLVIGLPVNMNGSLSHRAERSRRFALALSEATGLPYEMVDERLTTVEAYTYMNLSGTKSSKRRGIVDTLAAQIILQSYLDAHKA